MPPRLTSPHYYYLTTQHYRRIYHKPGGWGLKSTGPDLDHSLIATLHGQLDYLKMQQLHSTQK